MHFIRYDPANVTEVTCRGLNSGMNRQPPSNGVEPFPVSSPLSAVNTGDPDGQRGGQR